MKAKGQIPVQAAVVQMLIAKRPRLGQLPIDWKLANDGQIYADMAWGGLPSQVVETAEEFARALRGAQVDASEERKFADSGRSYRSHDVSGRQAGVLVNFHAVEYLDGHGDLLPKAGEQA